MTHGNDIPRAVIQSALTEIYRVAEVLYLAHGCVVPEGRSFARSIDSLAERCYGAAAVAYYNEICGLSDE